MPAALSRRVDPRSSLSLVWGRVSAGTVANAIPDSGVVEGTVRCLDDEAWHSAPDLLKGLIDSVASAYGLNAEFSYQRYVPPTVNDQASTAMISAAALGVLGAGSVVQTPQSLGGEDFAWYLESIPGALARLGTRVPGSTASLRPAPADVRRRRARHRRRRPGAWRPRPSPPCGTTARSSPSPSPASPAPDPPRTAVGAMAPSARRPSAWAATPCDR